MSINETLSEDVGAGGSDYPYALIFTTSKFTVTAFGLNRDNCEDVLMCVLNGRYKNNPDFASRAGEGDKEFVEVQA